MRSYRTVSALPVTPTIETVLVHRRSLSVARPSGRPNLALASTLPCGVPTFLDSAARTAAVTRPPHHCAIECTSVAEVRSVDVQSTQGPTPLIRSIDTRMTTDDAESRIASG